MTTIKTNILEFFPLPSIRPSQEIVIKEIDKVFKEGKRIVILEAPVGSGKSAIAVTFSNQAENLRPDGTGGTHLITPRKSLQDQYYEDFGEDLVLMKGRNAYPCTYEVSDAKYSSVITLIEAGHIKQPGRDEPNCADAPCRDNEAVFKMCTKDDPCPYTVATTIAQSHKSVVHNLHSFIFQSSFAGKFRERDLLIIDEAHEIEGVVRDFITKKITIAGDHDPSHTTLKEWSDFFLQDQFIPKESEVDRISKTNDKNYKSKKDKFLEEIAKLEAKDYFDKGFSVETTKHTKPNQIVPYETTFAFIPHYVGGAVNNLLLSYGKKVLLMSGTIYNKDNYCRNLGINPADAHFIRIGSSFPKENRPIYLKPEYQINTSHASWYDNFDEMIEIIKKIFAIFHDAKGLIHAPSYKAAEELRVALNDSRVVTHGPSDFLSSLESFYARPGNGVFVSPVCQQGVDFKGDRARFQIILRVPYQSTSSKFVEDKVKTDYPWYNYQALIVFGQQIGRPVRSEDDYGATFLIDSRFNAFLNKNRSVLPTWVKEGFVFR
jgi:Rad3-related DNA helicase